VSSCIFFIVVVFYVNLAFFFLINTNAHFVVSMKSHKGLCNFKTLSVINLLYSRHDICADKEDFIKYATTGYRGKKEVLIASFF
jgi:hypothetical protein